MCTYDRTAVQGVRFSCSSSVAVCVGSVCEHSSKFRLCFASGSMTREGPNDVGRASSVECTELGASAAKWLVKGQFMDSIESGPLCSQMTWGGPVQWISGVLVMGLPSGVHNPSFLRFWSSF